MDKMITLAIVPLVIWIAVFAYLWMMDRKIARLEQKTEEDDL